MSPFIFIMFIPLQDFVTLIEHAIASLCLSSQSPQTVALLMPLCREFVPIYLCKEHNGLNFPAFSAWCKYCSSQMPSTRILANLGQFSFCLTHRVYPWLSVYYTGIGRYCDDGKTQGGRQEWARSS